MSDDDWDRLLAGRGGLSYEQLDVVAHRLHDLVTDVATAQVTREVADQVVIGIDTDSSVRLSPPDGYRRPASGSITTNVRVHARSNPEAPAELRIVVWPALGDADVADLQLARVDSSKHLDVTLAEIDPTPSPDLHDRVVGFVAEQMASLLASLNAAIQRSLASPGTDDDVAEYEGE